MKITPARVSILILFISTLSAYFTLNSPVPSPGTSSQNPPAGERREPPSSPPSPETTASIRNLPPANPTPAPASVSNPTGASRTVEFEVKDGLAIAYGDIILGKVELGTKIEKGIYEPSAPLLWDKPEIPFLISPDLPDPQRIEKAIEYFNQHTVVKFIPRTDQRDAIVFEVGPEHCYSSLGKTGGLQPIRLAKGCQTQEIMHEMMHALGFVHEQSRVDRDQFIEVLWGNIEEKYKSQFTIIPEVLMEAMRGSSFDYHSIMLYRPDTFGLRPGLITLRSVSADSAVEPVREGLSEADSLRLKHLFRL